MGLCLFWLYWYLICNSSWQASRTVVGEVFGVSWGVLGMSWGGLGGSWGVLGGSWGVLGTKACRTCPQRSGISRSVGAKMVQVGPKLGPKTCQNPFRRPSIFTRFGKGFLSILLRSRRAETPKNIEKPIVF